jgi:hypothetical protein
VARSLAPRSRRTSTFSKRGELEQYHAELMALPLATWKYRQGDSRQHLGFRIDGHEQLICVQPDRNLIDLSGYASMAVAALKVQQAQIDALTTQVKALEAQLKGRRQVCRHGRPSAPSRPARSPGW